MNLTLQFITEPDWVSHAIRWFTWSEFSHVDIVLPSGRLLGAHLRGGVAIRDPDYAVFSRVERRVVRDVPPVAVDWACRQIGKPYDVGAIVGLLTRQDWRQQDSWFCSELVARAFEIAGKPLLFEDSWRITPRDLMLSPLVEKI